MSDTWVVPGAPLEQGRGWRVWCSRPGTDDFLPAEPTVLLRTTKEEIECDCELFEATRGLDRRMAVQTIRLKQPKPGATYTVQVPGRPAPFTWRSLPCFLQRRRQLPRVLMLLAERRQGGALRGWRGRAHEDVLSRLPAAARRSAVPGLADPLHDRQGPVRDLLSGAISRSTTPASAGASPDTAANTCSRSSVSRIRFSGATPTLGASDLPQVARPADEPHLPVRDLEAGDVPVRERATAGVEVARRRDRENLVRPAHARLRILELGTDGGGGSPDASSSACSSSLIGRVGGGSGVHLENTGRCVWPAIITTPPAWLRAHSYIARSCLARRAKSRAGVVAV